MHFWPEASKVDDIEFSSGGLPGRRFSVSSRGQQAGRRSTMEKITHRMLTINGLQIHIAEQGSGPLVVLVHGFPELWYTWRYQIPFLAEAGYHVVAPDLRGAGQSDVPADVAKYTMIHHAGDVVGVIEALGEKQAFVAGHDWGSSVVSHVALFRPDLVRGVVHLSVPYASRNPKADLLTAIRATIGDKVYPQQWQSTAEGEAEADFAKHGTKNALTKIFSFHSLEVPQSKNGKTILEGLELPDPLPSWLKDEDLQYYADSFDKTGFTGAFNFYRNIRSTWELTAAWTGQAINAPTIFITGDQDLCLSMMPPDYTSSPAYKKAAPNATESVVFPGVGHFLLEEAPALVNNAMLKFFKSN